MRESDFKDLVELLKLHEVTFRLVPTHITGFKLGIQLDWIGVQFDHANANEVPNGRGVYAFIVEETGKGLPPHGYVMYVGKAGDGAHSLRKRFRDYFQDIKRPKRPSIYNMLNQWGDVLSFYFAEIHNPDVQLTDLETALNDALLPPFSKNDFSAGVRKAINAFGN